MTKKSLIFYTDKYKEIAEKIKTFLNNQKDFLSARTQNSPRAVGDAIENIIVEILRKYLAI